MRTRTCKKNSTVLWHPIPRKRCCEWLVRYKGDSYAVVLLSCFMISVVTGLCTAFLWQRPLHCLKGHRVYYLVEEGGLRAVILATFFFFYFPSTCFFYVWSKKSDLSCFCFACCENLSHILGLSFAPQLFPQLSWVEDAGMCENRFQGSPQPETWLAEEFRTRGVRLFRTCLLVGFLFCVTVSSSARFCLCVLISFWFGFANDSAFHFF